MLGIPAVKRNVPKGLLFMLIAMTIHGTWDAASAIADGIHCCSSGCESRNAHSSANSASSELNSNAPIVPNPLAVIDLAHELAATGGKETPSVQYARTEVVRLRA